MKHRWQRKLVAALRLSTFCPQQGDRVLFAQITLGANGARGSKDRRTVDEGQDARALAAAKSANTTSLFGACHT
jgi:hypothetical protein